VGGGGGGGGGWGGGGGGRRQEQSEEVGVVCNTREELELRNGHRKHWEVKGTAGTSKSLLVNH
jgi:hypothetical protein